MTIRVTGGRLARRHLVVPRHGVRPTSDRAREALFSSLRDAFPDARVLDLFAGSGVLSVEAVSRGARQAILVEKDRATVRALESNIEALGLDAELSVVLGDARRVVLELPAASFDVIFLDPPYDDPLDERFLGRVEALLTPRGLLVVERRKNDARPLVVSRPMVFDRAYGEVWFRVFAGAGDEGAAHPSTTAAADGISEP